MATEQQRVGQLDVVRVSDMVVLARYRFPFGTRFEYAHASTTSTVEVWSCMSLNIDKEVGSEQAQ